MRNAVRLIGIGTSILLVYFALVPLAGAQSYTMRLDIRCMLAKQGGLPVALIAAACPWVSEKPAGADTNLPSLNRELGTAPQLLAEGSSYTVTDLGFTWPTGINGTDKCGFNGSAFLWTKANGMHALAGTNSALDINDRGQVVGQFQYSNSVL